MKSLPPRIVIGLTGPMGSGCSKLARFFDDPDDFDREHGNEFLRLLIKDGLVSRDTGGLLVDWQRTNRTVADRLNEYQQVKRKAEAVDNNSSPPGHEEERKRIFSALGRLLEERESLKALPFLMPYYPDGKPHLFRTLSMSDIIVFRALVEIDRGEPSPDLLFNRLAQDGIKKIEEGMNIAELQEKGLSTVRAFYEEISRPSTSDSPERLIKAFKVIHREARSLKNEFMRVTQGKDIERLQEFGNNIRQYGNPFGRGNGDASPKECCVQLAHDMERVINLIHKAGKAAFFVVDCLRNPYEVLYFRQRFPLFYLVSIYADKELRRQRRLHDLTVKGVRFSGSWTEEEADRQFDKADELDSGKKNRDAIDDTYRQHITRCVQMSDYAINNMENRADAESLLHDKLLRLVSLILSPGSSKPRKEEVYMNMAYAMAVKSNCISRQVGAVITEEDGYIVGAGWNDVASGDISCGLRPLCDLKIDIHRHIREQVKKNGRLYLEESYAEKRKCGYGRYPIDQACFCLKDEMARNEVTKNLQKALVANRSENAEFLKEARPEDIVTLIEKARLHQPEYCVALHAEENAVIQGSRIGGPGVRKGTIYVTAQPCTLCAKTIKQAGIVKVVYTDPYPKSEPNIFMNGVKCEQFEGVKPRAYIRLFMPSHDQKEWQDLESQNALPGLDLNSQRYLYPLG